MEGKIYERANRFHKFAGAALASCKYSFYTTACFYICTIIYKHAAQNFYKGVYSMNQSGNYNQFALRKVHSLFGIIPLGLFLIEHLVANSTAIISVEAFAGTVEFLESLPGLWVLEVFLIALPLLIHGLMGLYIVYQARNNPKSYSYTRNWMFYLQRISGLIIFAFILYHLFTVKFGNNGSFYEVLHSQLNSPLIAAFYAVSVTAAAFHFCNGLWGFAINWGILRGARAQLAFSRITIVLFVIFNIFWIRAMFAFM
ncbi:MAG: succinate dehydrogenase / fumarate reductase, cytochrome b subunit [Clostridia bacterium]|jgi:succinate dehydrogenase / fumarate reductase cytochrome b subunit|nr:succinate dehydrogenase / fumarate reductase, cytochrome b subunit [Clostridia bacterium]